MAYTNVCKLELVRGNDTVYLLYYDNAISSVRLPQTTGPSFFVTDNLSGCAAYIARNDHGRLVVFHANTHKHSAKEDLSGQRPLHQHEHAERELDTLLSDALNNDNSNPTLITTLRKSTYLHQVDSLIKASATHAGGVVVAGFRNGASWTFAYQVLGSIGGGPNKPLVRQTFCKS